MISGSMPAATTPAPPTAPPTPAPSKDAQATAPALAAVVDTPAPAAPTASAAEKGPTVRAADSTPSGAGADATDLVPAVPDTPAPRPLAPDTRPVLAVLEVINEGVNRGTRYEVRVPLAHIGRGAHNDVAIDDDSVSDIHAKLQRREDGWYLIDLGSTNGTYVGGSRLTHERRLDGVPDVRFGGVKLTFRPADIPVPGVKSTR